MWSLKVYSSFAGWLLNWRSISANEWRRRSQMTSPPHFAIPIPEWLWSIFSNFQHYEVILILRFSFEGEYVWSLFTLNTYGLELQNSCKRKFSKGWNVKKHFTSCMSESATAGSNTIVRGEFREHTNISNYAKCCVDLSGGVEFTRSKFGFPMEKRTSSSSVAMWQV